jgi:YHS domain-containing protein
MARLERLKDEISPDAPDRMNHDEHQHRDHPTLPAASPSGDPPRGAVARDPVCGMDVVPETAPASIEHDGRTYYFCCGHCRSAFEQEPGRYLSSAAG